MKMNNKNNNQKLKIINLGKKNIKDIENGKKQTVNHNQKKVIESYYIKNNGIQYIKKKLNFENYTTFDKKNNISLFSFLSSQTNQDDKITNNSLKTTKESYYNQINLKYSNANHKKKNFFYSKNIGSTMNYYHKNNNNKQISHQNFELNKELDNFKNRIDGIMRVIEDFETNYINSSESKRIKDELNDITTNKNYFNKSQDTVSIKVSGDLRTSQKNTKTHQKSIYFRESNKNIFNNEKNSNKTMIIKNHKLNLIDNHHNNKFSSTKNIKNININNTSIISNRNDRNKKKEINKNNIIKNSYNRRINYSSLLEVKTINKDKDKKVNKERKKNNENKNNVLRTKPKTYHYPSKSNDLRNFETIYNYKKTKYKTILNNNIQISNFNKTPKIYKVNKKINKMVKQKSKDHNNNINTNTNKKILKKFYK
jgi:hypothetical protein